MDVTIICTIIVILSIDFWLRNYEVHFTSRKRCPIPNDYYRAFQREGIDLDELTYKNVIKFIEEGNVEAAEYLMMIRCDCSVEKVRHAINNVYIDMYGAW